MLEHVTVSTSTPHSSSATPRFLAVATLCAASLGVLYVLEPASLIIDTPESVKSAARQVISCIDVTTVLAATAALAVVAMVRNLHYGIGGILLVGVGANLTGATLSSWLTNVPAALLPNGHVVAAAALYGAAVLICAPRWRPAIIGLGISVVAGVCVGVVTAGMSGIFGVLAGLLVAAIWGCVAAILMEHSPEAAQREQARPDTAAIAFSRDRRISL